jgi:N-acetylmuramoyl-L-alanine amidase
MKKIFIDPGHGGADNGASYGFVEEDDTNLIIAYLLRFWLRARKHLDWDEYTVRLSREKDIYVSLSDRCRMANDWGTDIFVSIHCDAFHNSTVTGISTHIYEKTKVSEPLGTAIQTQLIKTFPDHHNRKLKRSNFYVLRETKMPACLVECEFLSNPETRAFLKEPENQLALAEAIGKGITIYEEGRRC